MGRWKRRLTGIDLNLDIDLLDLRLLLLFLFYFVCCGFTTVLCFMVSGVSLSALGFGVGRLAMCRRVAFGPRRPVWGPVFGVNLNSGSKQQQL